VTSGVAQTQAESAVMASTAAKFEQTNQDLTSMLNNLMSELSVLSSAWKDLSDLNRALLETAEAIRSSGTSYDVSDSDAAARVTKSGGGGVSLPL
jgi:hypothetical protein